MVSTIRLCSCIISFCVSYIFSTAVASCFTDPDRNQSVAALIWLFGWQYLTLFDIHGSLLPQIYSIYNLTLSLAVHHCQTMIVGAFSTRNTCAEHRTLLFVACYVQNKCWNHHYIKKETSLTYVGLPYLIGQ